MSDLTRWLELFKRDETLRPKGLSHEGSFWWLETPVNPGNDIGEFTEPMPIQDEHAELLIIGRAVQWCNTRHEGLTIGDGSWDEKYEGAWPSGFSVDVFSPVIPKELRSGDTLIDALYEAVSWVMEWDEHLGHKPANSGEPNTK